MRMVAALEEYKSVAFSLNKTIIQCFIFMKGNNTSMLNYSKLNILSCVVLMLSDLEGP